MRYLITQVTATTVTVWDQVTKDKNNKMAGLMTFEVGPHMFSAGQVINIKIALDQAWAREQQAKAAIG